MAADALKGGRGFLIASVIAGQTDDGCGEIRLVDGAAGCKNAIACGGETDRHAATDTSAGSGYHCCGHPVILTVCVTQIEQQKTGRVAGGISPSTERAGLK